MNPPQMSMEQMFVMMGQAIQSNRNLISNITNNQNQMIQDNHKPNPNSGKRPSSSNASK